MSSLVKLKADDKPCIDERLSCFDNIPFAKNGRKGKIHFVWSTASAFYMNTPKLNGFQKSSPIAALKIMSQQVTGFVRGVR